MDKNLTFSDIDFDGRAESKGAEFLIEKKRAQTSMVM